MGLLEEDAQVVADLVTEANLRGVDSHGVRNVLRYCEGIRQGFLNPRPNVRVINETPACIFVDADLSMGFPVSVWAMNRAIEKAKQVGIGYALLTRCTHQGAMYYYALMAARRDMIGFANCTSGPVMAHYGANASGIGNNPVAFAAPAGKQLPLVLDMACSVVAGGKVDVAREWGRFMPDNWALDKDGNPTTDPADVGRGGTLVPAGAYKTAGLAIMNEAITAVLSGYPLIAPMLSGDFARQLGGFTKRGMSSMMYAIDIATFTDVSDFKANVDRLIEELKKVRKVPGVDEIMMPGEVEFRTHQQRMRDGIPIAPLVAKDILTLAKQLDIKVPF